MVIRTFAEVQRSSGGENDGVDREGIFLAGIGDWVRVKRQIRSLRYGEACKVGVLAQTLVGKIVDFYPGTPETLEAQERVDGNGSRCPYPASITLSEVVLEEEDEKPVNRPLSGHVILPVPSENYSYQLEPA